VSERVTSMLDDECGGICYTIGGDADCFHNCLL
jgi:hypothetical protein